MGVMVLIFIWQPIPATGTPIGMIVFLALALLGTEALRRQTAAEFPDAQLGAATSAIRARLNTLRARGPQDEASATPTMSLAEQLERLAVLRDDGAITTQEYDAAKARLLVRPI
ncbi:MAG: SHOCT domain-containing protein [Solirubrobacterales bacterium]|nr:SHOCT domain-containing protein [Solirubrobacterales bacterium]